MSNDINRLRAELLINAADLLKDSELNEAASIKTRIAAHKAKLKLDAKNGTVTDPKTGKTIDLNTSKTQRTTKIREKDFIDNEKFDTRRMRRENRNTAHYDLESNTITLGKNKETAHTLAHEFSHGDASPAERIIFGYANKKFSKESNKKCGKNVVDPRSSSSYGSGDIDNYTIHNDILRKMKKKGFSPCTIRDLYGIDKKDLKRLALLINQLPTYGNAPTYHINLSELLADYKASLRIGKDKYIKSLDYIPKNSIKESNRLSKFAKSEIDRLYNAVQRYGANSDVVSNGHNETIDMLCQLLHMDRAYLLRTLSQKDGNTKLHKMIVTNFSRMNSKDVSETDMRKKAIATVRKKMNENYGN